MRVGKVIGVMGLMLLVAAGARAQAEPDRWEADIRAFEEADRQSPPPDSGVVFVGSSSIRLWETLQEDFPGVPVVRRGFGGSEMADAVRYAHRIVVPYRPRMVVVYAGDNDLAGGKTPERVLEDFQALVDTIHAALPEARVAFIAVKPSLARWHLAPQVRAANELVRRYTAHDARLAYVDVYTPMLGPDGTPDPTLFADDGLHLNAAGYALWRDVLAPFLP